MARLVVISNRVTPPRHHAAQAGGLAVALRAALRRAGGLWMGWSGELADPPGEHVERAGGVTYLTLDLTPSEHGDYYLGYANDVLWPLFHYRPGLVEPSAEARRGYHAVNARFADHLPPHLAADDLIWVHDYHLIPLGEELRRRGARQRLGFFLHIPFPTTEVMVALPHHRELVASLLAYDLVGLQTENDRRALCDYVVHEAGGVVHDDGTIEAFGRRARVAVFPIGIDPEEMARLAARSAAQPRVERLRQSLGGRTIVLGVDRLDYSKGLPQRLRAFAGLFARHPGERGKVILLQIAAPSRDEVASYRALRRELEHLAGQLNGQLGDPEWVPIRYVAKSYRHADLAGFYRMARVGLVTPLRDGMNLVAKEYVAAQDGEDPGVLVLSRFAGAARELALGGDGALVVNPFDLEAVADAIHRGLAMPRAERRARWAAMMEVLRRGSLTAWRKGFLAALATTASPAGG